MDQEYSLYMYSNTEMVNLAWVDYGCVYVFNATLTVPYHTLVEKLQCFSKCTAVMVQSYSVVTTVQYLYRYAGRRLTLDLATVFLVSRRFPEIFYGYSSQQFLLALILKLQEGLLAATTESPCNDEQRKNVNKKCVSAKSGE